MRYRAIGSGLAAAAVLSVAAWGQGPQPGTGPGAAGKAAGSPSPTLQATVETAQIDLIYPDRYAVPVVLEPSRRVILMAPMDGIIQDVPIPVGSAVRDRAEIAKLDRSEAMVKLRIAEANVKEAEAEAAPTKSAVALARVEAARARADLAKLELERCTLRAPFAGKLMAAPVSPGQYVAKGINIAEVADVSTLKVLVPVDRTTVNPGNDLELIVEGKPVAGKVQSLVPLPETYAALRELAVPWAAAWTIIPNPNGALEPGQRARGPFTPTAPITAVANRAVKESESGGAMVQIARYGNILDLPVKVLGDAGFERTQVSGAFLPSDAVIVESSVPLIAGTVIRFSGEAAVSGAVNGNAGTLMDVSPPIGGPARPSTGRIAPIGSPDNQPTKGVGARTKAGASAPTKAAAPKAPAKPATGGSVTPF